MEIYLLYNSKCHDLSLSPEAEPEVVQLSALPPTVAMPMRCPFVYARNESSRVHVKQVCAVPTHASHWCCVQTVKSVMECVKYV